MGAFEKLVRSDAGFQQERSEDRFPRAGGLQILANVPVFMSNSKGYTKHVILVQWAHAGRRVAADTGIQCARSWVYEHKNAFT